MSSLFNRHTPLFENPSTFQDLVPGECCIDDIFLSSATISLNASTNVWELTLTLNDETVYVVPFPAAFTQDIFVSGFARHPDALTNPAFVNVIRITLNNSSFFDLDLSFISGGGGGGESLSATLLIGNTTGGTDIIKSSGDSIKASASNGTLNLEISTDTWFLGNLTSPTTTNSYITGSTSQLNIGMDASIPFGLEAKGTSATLGGNDVGAPASFFVLIPDSAKVLNESTLTIPNETIEGVITCIDSLSQTRNFVSTSAKSLSLNSGLFESVTSFNSNISNSVALGGVGLTIKTKDSAYANKLILQNQNNTNDFIVLPPVSHTGDHTAFFQNSSGTIAYLSNIQSSFNVDLDSSQASVTKVIAAGTTTFTITHNLNTLDLKPEIFRLSDGATVFWTVIRSNVNTIKCSRAGNVADGLFRVLI